MGNFVTGTRLTATHLGTLAGCRAMARHFHATPQARASGGRPSCRSHRLVRTQIPLPKSPFEVTAVDAGTSWAWRGDILWLTLNFNHVVEPEGDGTRITFDLNLNGRGEFAYAVTLRGFSKNLKDPKSWAYPYVVSRRYYHMPLEYRRETT